MGAPELYLERGNGGLWNCNDGHSGTHFVGNLAWQKKNGHAQLWNDFFLVFFFAICENDAPERKFKGK